jgi:hypothetical protein
LFTIKHMKELTKLEITGPLQHKTTSRYDKSGTKRHKTPGSNHSQFGLGGNVFASRRLSHNFASSNIPTEADLEYLRCLRQPPNISPKHIFVNKKLMDRVNMQRRTKINETVEQILSQDSNSFTPVNSDPEQLQATVDNPGSAYKESLAPHDGHQLSFFRAPNGSTASREQTPASLVFPVVNKTI